LLSRGGDVLLPIFDIYLLVSVCRSEKATEGRLPFAYPS